MKFSLTLLTALLFFSCKTKSPAPKAEDNGSTIFRKLPGAEREKYIQVLHNAYDSLLKRNFNGSIIVAKNGDVLLEEYIGYSNFKTKDTITANTSFHIASVSKTFTGMAVLKLCQEGKLQLQDSIQQYFPGFPYHGITIKMLLTHRSGLPNYVHEMPGDSAWKRRGHLATNNDMLQFLITRQPKGSGLPDKNFHYCNTNYALLALIIEKVSGQPFPQFMKNNVFAPLGMNNTYVFSISDSASYIPSYLYPDKPILLENTDCIYGDKNIYSTPRDILLWDKALYQNTFVNKAIYDSATRPYSFERPSMHNYGLGWRLMILPDNKIVYHNGWWHGNNASFTRLTKDTVTIIVTGNRYNQNIYKSIQLGKIFSHAMQGEQKQTE